MAASGCKAAVGCVDARVPVRASYVNLYKWPESDAEFVRSVARRRRGGGGAELDDVGAYHSGNGGHGSGRMGSGSSSPRVVDSYSCRQMYLRSYTFSKEPETVPEKTMRCLGRVRARAAVFPGLVPRAGATTETSSVSSSCKAGHCDRPRAARGDDDGSRRRRRRRRRSRRKEECGMMERLREASRCAISAVFRRLLACTASVEVADGGPPGPSG